MTQFFQLTDLGLLASPTALLQQWLSFMQQSYPGYTPQAGNLEYIQAVIFASWASDLAYQASQGANDLFRTFGTEVVGVLPLLGSAANAVVTVTATDTAGYSLAAGSQFLLDNTWGFQSGFDAVIPQGSTSTQLSIYSILPGSAPNGAGVQSVSLNQEVDWVSAVALVSAASGGVDAETDDQYQTRLTEALQQLAPRPITASDYANFVINFQPAAGTDQQEIGRAAAIDGYDPAPPVGPGWSPLAAGTGTLGNEREVTVAVTDANGIAVNSDTMAAAQEYLEGFREANFIVNVVPPNYTAIYVTCSLVRNTAVPAATVQQNVQTALLNLFNPASWGAFPGAVTPNWNNLTTVYPSVVEATIQSAVGVNNIVTGTLGMGFNPNPNGAQDLALPGPFPLPAPPLSEAAALPLSGFTVVN